MNYRITAWFYRRDEMEPEGVGSPLPTLEESQIAAQAFYFNQSVRPYSMSVSDQGVNIWKWKPGRDWELQTEINKAAA